MKVSVPFSFCGITMLCTVKTNRASLDTPGREHLILRQKDSTHNTKDLQWRSPTRWKLEGHHKAIMWARALWPLQLRVERVQDVELHGFEEAVTFVLKYNRHNHLTTILQVSLDVTHLNERKKKTSLHVQFFIFHFKNVWMTLWRRHTMDTANLIQQPNTKAHITVSKKPLRKRRRSKGDNHSPKVMKRYC